MRDVLAQVQQVAAEVFDSPADAIQADSSPQTLSNWDSIQHLNFIMSLESRFKVEFSPEEMESIKHIGDAARLIAGKQGLSD